MLVARRAISVIGRRPIDASHSPPAPARSRAIGITTTIASRTSCCSRAMSVSGRATTSVNVAAPIVSGSTWTRHSPEAVSTVLTLDWPAAGSRSASVTRIELHGERRAAAIENRDGIAKRPNRVPDLGRGQRGAVVLSELLAKQIRQRDAHAIDLPIGSPDAQALLLARAH